MRRNPIHDSFDDRDELPREVPSSVRRVSTPSNGPGTTRRGEVRYLRAGQRVAPRRGPDPRVWFIRGSIGVAALAGLWLGLQALFPMGEWRVNEAPAPTAIVDAGAASVTEAPPAAQAPPADTPAPQTAPPAGTADAAQPAAAAGQAPAGQSEAAPAAPPVAQAESTPAAPAQPQPTPAQPPLVQPTPEPDHLPGLQPRPADATASQPAPAEAQAAPPEPAAPAQPEGQPAEAADPAAKPTAAPIPPPENAQPAAAAPRPAAPAAQPAAPARGAFDVSASASPANPISEQAQVTISVKATQNGAPVAGAFCMATIYYRTATAKQPNGGFTTNSNGVGSFVLDARGTTYGYYIPVDVTCTGRSGSATTRTGFTPVKGR